MHGRLSILVILALAGLFIGCDEDDDPVSPRTLKGIVGSDVINLIQWSTDQGGNDHYYGVMPVELYRDQIGQLVSTYDVKPWKIYLATITSADENAFILDHVVAGTDQPSVLDAFWLDAQYVGGQWYWSTGESFDYTIWASSEPSHLGIETAMTMWGPNNTASNRTPGTWNDAPPDSFVNELAKFWALVEFE